MKMLLSELRRLIQSTIEEMANRAPAGAELDELPVVVEGGVEGYSIYVESGGMFENDLWSIVHRARGIVRHYRSDQIRIHVNATFGIVKGT
jgi:hypothetical protein